MKRSFKFYVLVWKNVIGLILMTAVVILNAILISNRVNHSRYSKKLRDNIFAGPLPQDDPEVISYIVSHYLTAPTNLPYNLSNDPEYVRSSHSFGWGFINRILLTLFSDHPSGFFVEAGALDGEYISNTLWLEQTKGWTGLLVEPDQINFRDLVYKRRKAWLSPACLSSQPYPKEATMVYSRVHRAEQGKLVRMITRGGTHELGLAPEIESYKQMERITHESYYNRQCFPLYSFLLALNITVIDFLSLDVQGSERNILKTLPLDKVKIRSFVIEDGKKELNMNLIQEINKLGYALVSIGGSPDYFFVNEKEEMLLKKFKKPILQKYVYDKSFVYKFV